MRGCGIAVLVVIGLVVAVGLGSWGVGVLTRPHVPELIEPGCSLVTPSKARELLGPDAVTSTRLNPPFDRRVLLDSAPCWVTANELGREIIVVQQHGADARTRYERERDTARNGRVPYFDRDVPDVGDEAFCTTADYGSVGLLVRRDDHLVDVIVVPSRDDVSRSVYGTNDMGWQVSGTLCLAARTAARAILA